MSALAWLARRLVHMAAHLVIGLLLMAATWATLDPDWLRPVAEQFRQILAAAFR